MSGHRPWARIARSAAEGQLLPPLLTQSCFPVPRLMPVPLGTWGETPSFI